MAAMNKTRIKVEKEIITIKEARKILRSAGRDLTNEEILALIRDSSNLIRLIFNSRVIPK